MGASRRIEPRYMVANQLNTLTAEGMETLKVSALKIMFAIGDIEVNM